MKVTKDSFSLTALICCTVFSLGGFAIQAREADLAPPGTSFPTQRPANSKLDWTQFQDPFEKAFTVDVPQGWTVRGGLFRLGYSDERVMVDLRSPDGQINIRIGDVSIPSYTTPSQFHAREGEIYDLGAQAQMIVARYRTGPEFAVLYSQSGFLRSCRNPQTDLADSDFSAPDYIPADSPATRSSSGQIAYRCETDAGPRVGFTYAKTALSGQIWQVPAIVSFLVLPDQVPLARDIVRRCAGSFRINPEWIEYQKRMDAEGLQYQRARQQKRLSDLQAQVQQFEAKMQAMQNQVNAFERRQSAQASQVESFTNALVGITPTTDPLTGENRQVWTGPKNNYWVNGTGQVVNSTNAPAAGWRQLQTN